MRQTRENYKLEKAFMEHPKGKSLTIPDESFTVQQLMERMVAGIPTITNVPYDIDDEEGNHDDEDLEAFSRMDITDQEEILEQHREVIEAKTTYKEKAAKKKAEEKAQKDLDDYYEKRKKKEDENNAKKSVATQH